MTSDMGELFNARKKEQQEKRAANRESSPLVLNREGFGYEAKNGGAHLIVNTASGLVDFWPGTGLFIIRSTKKEGRGVHNLLRLGKPGDNIVAEVEPSDRVNCPICNKRVKRLGVGVHAAVVHGAHVTTPGRGKEPRHLRVEDLLATDADREMLGDDAENFGLTNIGNK